MNNFKERLIKERNELSERISKLEIFINSSGFILIEDIQKSLLMIQLQSMKAYEQCLNERIDWLNK
jgi:hypothetical protein